MHYRFMGSRLSLILVLVCIRSFGFTTDKLTRPHIQFTLFTDHKHVSPGQSFWAGVQIEIEDAWHIYWTNSGAGGKGSRIAWKGEALVLEESFWPAPSTETSYNKPLYVHKKEIIPLARFKVLPKKAQQATITSTIHWTICKEVCLPPQEIQLSTNLPIHSKPKQHQGAVSLLAKAQKHIPRKHNFTLEASQSNNKIFLYVKAPDNTPPFTTLEYFPMEDFITSQKWIHRSTHEYLGTLETNEQLPGTLDGLLSTTHKAGQDIFTVKVEVRGLSESTHAYALQEVLTEHSETTVSFMTLILAFLGGLILNVMPCVFPVLSLKILAFIEQDRYSRYHFRKQGLSFALGVLVSFWVLVGILLVLRSTTHDSAWGFQMQSPEFIMGMGVFFFGMALNLFGVFEFAVFTTRLNPSGTEHQGLVHSFTTGVLATVSASPCSAPILGSVIGIAFFQPEYEFFVIFTFVGLGMAFPYVAFTYFPQALRFLPKPGQWMVSFRQFLGFMLMFFIVYLLWILGQQTNVTVVCEFLVSLLFVAMALWVMGHQVKGLSKKVLVLCCVVLAWYSIPSQYYSVESAWRPFSRELVDELRQDGRIIFIDFTAAWCITCQTNKLFAINTDTVQKRFQELNVATLRADWTTQDARITQELARHQRAAVPFYLLYTGDPQQAPLILPEVLTPSILLNYLNTIKET